MNDEMQESWEGRAVLDAWQLMVPDETTDEQVTEILNRIENSEFEVEILYGDFLALNHPRWLDFYDRRVQSVMNAAEEVIHGRHYRRRSGGER
jgi:predicted nucleotidyltransferase